MPEKKEGINLRTLVVVIPVVTLVCLDFKPNTESRKESRVAIWNIY